jgi:hypothetical protein
VCVFLVNWDKLSLSFGEVQLPQMEFLTPICQTLLVHEVKGARLHPVTIEFSPDFYCLGQFFRLVFYCFDSFLKSFYLKTISLISSKSVIFITC